MMSLFSKIFHCLLTLTLVTCMEINSESHAPLLLEGELLLDKSSELDSLEIRVRIVDITHIDAKSVLLAESIEVQAVKPDQTTIPFRIFGQAPDSTRRYIVMATIAGTEKGDEKKTLYRTTQSIPVFRNDFSDPVTIPLTKMD